MGGGRGSGAVCARACPGVCDEMSVSLCFESALGSHETGRHK